MNGRVVEVHTNASRATALRRAAECLRMQLGRAGVVHHDMSCRNLLVRSDNGGLTLVDFELSTVDGEPLPRPPDAATQLSFHRSASSSALAENWERLFRRIGGCWA